MDKENRGKIFLINLETLYFLFNKGQKVIWGTENNDPECKRMGVERQVSKYKANIKNVFFRHIQN